MTSTAKFNSIAKSLNEMSTNDLSRLSDQIHHLIDQRKTAEAIAADVLAPARTGTGRQSNRRQHSTPWIETRIVKGHPYRYQVQWINWKREVTYLGKA
jgi:hypothetical protein